MRSDRIKKGFERAPHRSLLKATGVTDADMGKPFIAVVNSYVDIIPGHVHLQDFGQVVKEASARRAACRSNSTPSASMTASRWATSA